MTPIAYGPGLLERARAAAPGGYDVALDAIGTDEAIDVSLQLVASRRAIATVVAIARGRREGIKVLGGNPSSPPSGQEICAGARWRLLALAADGLEIVMGSSFPLTSVADVHRELVAGRLSGRTVLTPG